MRCTQPHLLHAVLNTLEHRSQTKTAHHKKTEQQASDKDEDEDEVSIDPGLYFGPNVVKNLFVFDFDGTLFHTPDPVEGRKEYLRITGK